MAIDMRQFHQTFFEESLEGLTVMEGELLHLEKAACASGQDTMYADPEILNTIFRSAHSIKGGSSTFGFGDVAAFAHVLESRLDALPDGRSQPSQRVVGLLLLSVDCPRSLIVAAKTGKEADRNAIEAVRVQLEKLESENTALPVTGKTPTQVEALTTTHWHILFRPNPRMFHTGNDPLRILRELAGLGKLKTTADVSGLPSWEQLNPEECYLAWNVELAVSAALESIADVFSWVADECRLEIAPKTMPAPMLSQRTVAEAVAFMDTNAGTLRVNVPKIDALINTVGELVITQTMLSQIATNFSFDNLSKLFAGLEQLERNTRELQESVMRIRMLPLSFAFNRLPRLVHDMSQKLGKRVELIIRGERTEIDKTVIDRIVDPLLHLARNCIDHGIETAVERAATGKP